MEREITYESLGLPKISRALRQMLRDVLDHLRQAEELYNQISGNEPNDITARMAVEKRTRQLKSLKIKILSLIDRVRTLIGVPFDDANLSRANIIALDFFIMKNEVVAVLKNQRKDELFDLDFDVFDEEDLLSPEENEACDNTESSDTCSFREEHEKKEEELEEEVEKKKQKLAEDEDDDGEIKIVKEIIVIKDEKKEEDSDREIECLD